MQANHAYYTLSRFIRGAHQKCRPLKWHWTLGSGSETVMLLAPKTKRAETTVQNGLPCKHIMVAYLAVHRKAPEVTA